MLNTLIQFGVILVIAGICGAIAQALLGMPRSNFLLSMGIGVLGAYFGAYLAQLFGWPRFFELPIGTVHIDLVWAIAGSALLVFILGLIKDTRRWRRR